MINQKQLRIGGLNSDDSLELLGEDDYLNLMNGYIALSEDGKNNRIENCKGTTAISNAKYPPYGSNQCIGSCIDIENKRLIWFIYNTAGDDGIYAYSFDDNQVYAVLYDSQVSGGLSFDKNYRIDRNCKVVSGLLYWTDNLNEPRCINIDSGIKLNQTGYVTDAIPYTAPIDSTSITLIKRPPAYPLTAARVTDSGYDNNFTARNSFKFYYRYSFYDNQISANSAMSDLIPYNYEQDTYNAVDLTFSLSENIRPDVEIVQVIVQFGNTNTAFIIKEYNKNNPTDAAAISAHNAGTALSFRFYNDVTGIALSASEQSNFQDAVPLRTKTIELAKDRLFLGANLKGYDSPVQTSLGVTYTDTTTLTVDPKTTGTMAEIGFNTPTTVPNVLVGAPIVTADYKLTTQNYLSADPAAGMYPTWADNDMLYQDLTGSTTTLLVNGRGQIWNSIVVDEYRYTQISFYFYISTASTKTTTKLATYTVEAGEQLTIDFNFSLRIPANAKVWLVVNPDLGVTGVNDNKFRIDSSKVYVIDDTTIVYPPAHFKRGGSYQFATAFYDKYRRKCGVITNNSATLHFPIKGYDPTPANYATWTLSNTSAEAEIPDWAYYYQILITKNLQQSSFIQSVAQSIFYAIKDTATGLYTYTQDTYGNDSSAIGVNLGGINGLGIGYTFNDGDLITLSNDNGDSYVLMVTGVDGNWVLCEKQDIGILGSYYLWQFEIYTPYKDNLLETYYEATPVYTVTNPTLSSRTYGTLTGDIYGDTYYIIRSDSINAYYQAEAMNPNDKFWSIWDRNLGWVNIKDTIGQKELLYQIDYSDTIIEGSKTNGLNKIGVLNNSSVDTTSGTIQKLQLSTKQEADGKVMLAICESATSSLYLSETQLVASAQNDALATSTNVIGTINVLRGMFGTRNPETVIEYLGNIYWYDANNGVVVQYSTNGLFPISTYKMTNFFAKYARQYLATSAANLDAINGFHHIPTSIDPFRKRFQITTPALIYANYAEVLPSYNSVPSYASSIINRFNPYTGLGQTLTFDTITNRWKESIEFVGEWYDNFENKLFGFKNGTIYLHNDNSSTRNNFYGVQYPLRFCFTPNQPFSGVKDVTGVTAEGNVIPDYSVLYSDYPNVQITDLTDENYRDVEGVMYGNWFRDRLSPNVSGTADEKMYKGDIVKSKTPQIMMEFQQYTDLMYLSCADVNFAISRGQTQILSK
jgi:hypothetical protein